MASHPETRPSATFIALLGVILFAAAACGGIIAIDSWHRSRYATPLEPGRWESSGGEYFIELVGDMSSGAARLPLDEFCDHEPIATGAVEVSPYGVGPVPSSETGVLEIHFDDVPAGSRDGSHGGLLSAGGLLSSGYDWNTAEWSTCDPDVVTLVLHRVVVPLERTSS